MKSPHSVVLEMQVTEKGTRLTESENKYLFRVHPSATKPEIKAAVQKLFKVAVVKVNTMHYFGKQRRERFQRYGWRPDWKRAVVTVKKGEKIDLE